MLSAEPRVSFHTASIRPLGDTDMVPNHWNARLPGVSSLTRTGALQVWPPSVLRMKCTSIGSVGIHSWPSSPPGLGPPVFRNPLRSTVTVVKVGGSLSWSQA